MGVGKKVLIGAVCVVVAAAAAVIVPHIVADATGSSYYVHITKPGEQHIVAEAGESFYSYDLTGATDQGQTSDLEVDSMLGNGPLKEDAWLKVRVATDGTVQSFSEVPEADVPTAASVAVAA